MGFFDFRKNKEKDNVSVSDIMIIDMDNKNEYYTYELSFEGTKVAWKVPVAFEVMEDEEETTFEPDALERFGAVSFTSDTNQDVDMVDCYIHAPHMINYNNAEEYVKYTLSDCSEVKEKDRNIQQIILFGRQYYYFIVRYKSEFGKFQNLCAACDVGDGKIYAVETEVYGWAHPLSLEQVASFMNIEE